LLDRVRQALRVRHYSLRTEEAYVAWIRRYIYFHHIRHPQEMGAAEINAFLTDLAVNGQVAASTQNQAFSALLFLYRTVLEVDPGQIAGVIRAQRPRRLPVVVLGKGGGQIKTGRILDYQGKPNRKMCSLYLSLMEKAGVRLDAFGDSKERLMEV